MVKALEDIVIEEKLKVSEEEKVIVTGDWHIPFIDNKAYNVTKAFCKKYKPDIVVINGDLLDFYRISKFDKNPARKEDVSDNIHLAKEYLKDFKDSLPNKTELYLLDGNHDVRLEQFLWKTPELYSLLSEYVSLNNLLELDKQKIKYLKADADYWKSTNCHLEIADTIIMHGDSRINGAKGGINAAINTAKKIRKNTIINHTHNLNLKYESNGYNTIFGGNAGCLCMKNGMADWQQGILTFEVINDKSENPQIHRIIDGVLYGNSTTYKSK